MVAQVRSVVAEVAVVAVQTFVTVVINQVIWLAIVRRINNNHNVAVAVQINKVATGKILIKQQKQKKKKITTATKYTRTLLCDIVTNKPTKTVFFFKIKLYYFFPILKQIIIEERTGVIMLFVFVCLCVYALKRKNKYKNMML